MTQGLYRATFTGIVRYYVINLDVNVNLFVPSNDLRADILVYNTLLFDNVDCL